MNKNESKAHGTDITVRGLIEMYDAAMFLHPEYTKYYRSRIIELRKDLYK